MKTLIYTHQKSPESSDILIYINLVSLGTLYERKGFIMTRVIVLILILVLTLSLFGIAVLGQASGARELAERGTIEQDKVNMMLSNPNIVTGNTVKSYIARASKDSNLTIDVDDEDGDPLSESNIIEGALFEMEKTYDEDGKLERVDFDRVDLSKTK